MTVETAEFPVALRRFIYDQLLSRGLPPSSEQIGEHFGVSTDDARQAIGSLKIGKTVLAHPTTGEIWMAGPFAARPSTYGYEATCEAAMEAFARVWHRE